MSARDDHRHWVVKKSAARRRAPEASAPLRTAIARRILEAVAALSLCACAAGPASLPWDFAPDPVTAPRGAEAKRNTPAAPVYPQYVALKAALAETPPDDAERIALLQRNLERWRTLPADPGTDYLLVNLPAFELIRMRDGAEIDRRRIIIGKPATPTPAFAAEATGVIVNPSWTVPASIVRESVGALLANDPEGARRKGFERAPDGSIRQRPGPGNALGRVKLDMPNPHTVFIHDTPDKTLFERPRRAFSHGCARLEGAIDFARSLLEAPGAAEAFDRGLAAGATMRIALERPLPIYFVYFTAFTDRDGGIATYEDVYGRDAPDGSRGAAPATPACAPDPL